VTLDFNNINKKKYKVSLGIYGSSALTLDLKGRIAVPARYRALLRKSCEGSLVITKDPQYPALIIYPGRLWKDISAKFEALGGLNHQVRSIQWKILGNASVSEFEVSERMVLLIPQILRDYANLKVKEQVALIGMGSKFELWNLENWEKKQAGLSVEGEDLLNDLPQSLEEIPF
jgi:MraZ protein